MSDFRTTISLLPSTDKIRLNDVILTFGSCFSDNIGQLLKANKFSVLVNPLGVMYNPISIHQGIESCLGARSIPESSYSRKDDVFFNYEFHSAISSLGENQLHESINKLIQDTRVALAKSDYIILTYGTAFVHSLNADGLIVANCHKMPASLFNRRLLSVEEIIQSFQKVIDELNKTRPGARVILTVSPVRHTKDTLQLNAVSKAILRTACHSIAERFPQVTYFPAFEIMIDDLRDYRFYKSDLIHPNEQAETYIWNQFTTQFMDQASLDFIRQWQPIRSSLNHKPFQPASAGHRNFLFQLLQKLEQLKEIVNVDNEIRIVKDQLDG